LPGAATWATALDANAPQNATATRIGDKFGKLGRTRRRLYYECVGGTKK
jgi:hypothetical protein